MADLSKIKLNGTIYNLKDAEARDSLPYIIECSYTPPENEGDDAYYTLDTTFSNLFDILSNSGDIILKYTDDSDPTYPVTIMGRLISLGIYEGEQDESSSISICFVMPTINDRESSSTILIGNIVEDDEDLVLYAYNTIEDIYSTMNNKIDKELLISYIGNTGWDDSNFEINVIDNTEGFVLNNYIILVLPETLDINNTWAFIIKDLNGNIGSYIYNKSALNIYDIYDNLISNPTSIGQGLYTVVKTGTGVNSRFTIKPFLTNENVNNILTNNYYTLDEIEDLLDDYVPNNMIETTWANLISLRDNSQLVKGAWYRIIDYNFITSKVNIHSGNHQFDIIVLAISESMLSETAYAARHSGDTYFLRYISTGGIEWLYTVYSDDYAADYGEDIIDHADDIHSGDVFCDSDLMEHPDSGDVVPVLYKTDSNEYDFDDPDYSDVYFYEGIYDFEGDDYDMWSKWESDENTGNLVFKSQYALTPIVVDNGQLTVSPIPVQKAVSVNMNAWELKYCLDNDKTLFDWADTNGKGVIYYMKDEFGNEAPYDFKNAMFERRKITSVNNIVTLNPLINKYLGEPSYYSITCNANDKLYFYTFGDNGNNNSIATTDGSLFGANSYNVIKPYVYEGMKLINNIVCSGSNNIFENDCYDITVIGSNNSFGTNCYTNLLSAVSSTRFDERVHSFSLLLASSNIFGRYCNSTVGYGLSDCVIEGSCNNNNLGNACSGIKMGRACANNTFGNYCYNLTLGENVTTSLFGGSYCSYNTIGSFSSNIRITTNNVRYSVIEQNCKNITINNSNSSTYILYVKVCAGVSNITIQPTRGLTYEQIWYRSGRIENAV